MTTLPPILLVDDSPDDVLMLTRLLLKAGVKNQLVSFNNPMKACAFLEDVSRGAKEHGLPLLVFTDLNMPGMDGCAFARWFREHISETVPIIMATGSADHEDPQRAIKSGVTQVFPKFPKPEELLKSMRDNGCVTE